MNEIRRKNVVFNMDCMDYMKTLPDKAFELAIVDPPYGGVNDDLKVDHTGSWTKKYGRGKVHAWDSAPSGEYFSELSRVAENQIVWGGNYFFMPPTQCFIVWRKKGISENFSMAMCELAWTSFNRSAKLCEFYAGESRDNHRIHPTQKPVSLYKWILRNFAKKGDRILDTHVGSGSSRIASYDMGFDFVGCEIDRDYWELQENRFNEYASQRSLFEMDGGEFVEELRA